ILPAPRRTASDHAEFCPNGCIRKRGELARPGLGFSGSLQSIQSHLVCQQRAGRSSVVLQLYKPYRSGTVSLLFGIAPMLKISKLTDYGLLAAVYLARHNGEVASAREIAEFYHLPV